MPNQSPGSGRWFWPAVLLSGLTLLAYLPALHCGFVWDDDAYVTQNPLLTAPDGLRQIWFSKHQQSQYFPMVFTTFRVEYALWGLNPVGYHAVNILLHAANALLVWAVLRRFLATGAWLAAALWALHPVQVESVAWITELKNTQSTLFYLLAALAWLKFVDGRDRSRWWIYALALLSHALALFSKTTACTLPAALLLLWWWRGERIGWQRLLQVLPFLLAGIAMGLVSVWWEGHLGNYREEPGAEFGWLERLLIASRALWFYAGKLVWPASLTFSYPKWEINPREPLQYVWLIGCLAVALLLWSQRRRMGRGVIVGVLFFVATLSPLVGFIWLYTFRFSFVADHYQYLASLGLLGIAAAVIQAATRGLGTTRRFIQPAVSAALLLVLATLTWRQCGMYTDVETLWRTTLDRNPGSWMAHNNLGLILDQQGKRAEAIRHYRESLRLNPNFALAHNNLGSALLGQGQMDDGLAHLRRAVTVAPDYVEAQSNLGKALLEQGRLAEAATHFENCLRLYPHHPDAHYNLGNIAYGQARFGDAVTHFQAALQGRPDHLLTRHNLGMTLAALGRQDEAVAEFEAVLKLQPAFSPAEYQLGEMARRRGNLAEAAQRFRAAVQGKPDFAEGHHRLGIVLGRQQETGAAVQHLREAVRLKPDWVEALNSLAWKLATSPDAPSRNGPEAVRCAERAVALMGGVEAQTLDTLAAAYAEAARFVEATNTAQKAITVAVAAGNEQLSGEIRKRLRLYQSGRPYRE